MNKVTLFKDPIFEDFGFSLSDGLYERGIFVARIKPGGPADGSGLLRPFDRILQVMMMMMLMIMMMMNPPDQPDADN